MEDIFVKSTRKSQRLTQKQKNHNDKQWYKDMADDLERNGMTDYNFVDFTGISQYKKKKVNYDLFNNYVNMDELAYVTKPFGAEGGELPANFTNRDISSPKIKVLLGMEMGMPFDWKVFAINEEATTRKEQEEFGRIKQWVHNEIMKPIRIELEKQMAEQTKGQQLSPEEQQKVQQQIEEELKAQTPDEVRKYMSREHQDPAERLYSQMLEYLIYDQKIPQKFNDGFKHSLLGGHDIYHVGIFNNKPTLTVVNNLGFNSDQSDGLLGVEDGEWATCEYHWTPSQIVAKFGSKLSDKEIDKVYEYGESPFGQSMTDPTFTFNNDSETNKNTNTLKVLHCTFKGLMKIGFLIYLDDNREEQMMIVDENYKFNKQSGDISIQWEWVPEAHEVWKIAKDIYVDAQPIPGQYKDIDNLWECKLPYIGAACDNMNSPVTSAMDRIKGYQYFYDVIIYRIELLMASDKGKMLLMNIKAIPKSAKIDVNKFLYFMEANKIAFYSNTEEGMRNQNLDAGSIAKEIDMSLASDIMKYINMAEYIETKCGASIGVTKAMEGAIGPTDAVTNTKQNLIQASHIIKPYFILHNVVKGNVLNQLLKTARVAYMENPPGTLNYILDDLSMRTLAIDQELLESSTCNLFVANSVKAEEAKQAVINLSQAAMQNQQIDLLDVIKVIKSNSLNEAEEQVTIGMEKRQEQAQAMEKAKMEQEKQMIEQQNALREREMQHEADMIVLKAKEDRQTKKEVAAVQALGFAEDKDVDNDGTPDVVELAGLELKSRKQDLDEQAFEHQKEIDRKKLENDKEKIKVSKIKKSSS